MGSRRLAALAACALLLSGVASAYDNFHVAIYCRAQEVQKMADPKWLADSWAAVSREVHVDKVYIETHRDRILIDDATLEAAKKFFTERGVTVAGGITFTVNVAIHSGHEVIDTGPYRLIRHPSYTGALLAFLGLALCMANWWSLALVMVPILWAFGRRMSIEESALASALGAPYTQYMSRTKRLAPFIY